MEMAMELLIMFGKAFIAFWLATPLVLLLGWLRFWWLEKKYPNNTCIGGPCSECTDHINCECPHHDRVIMKLMQR